MTQSIHYRSSHQRCSVKKLFLKVSQNSQENFIKKETLAQMFSCEFCETFENTFFTEHLWTTASEIGFTLMCLWKAMALKTENVRFSESTLPTTIIILSFVLGSCYERYLLFYFFFHYIHYITYWLDPYVPCLEESI